MKTFIISLLLILLPASKSFACLNTYFVVDKHGHTHDAEKIELSLNKNFDLKTIQPQMLGLELTLKNNKSYKALSDYAVCLLKIGKTEEALEILIALNKKYPSEYQIAANLGTAYELNGQVENALVYIKKGVLLNPASHHGSEWVHVKILEAKLALQKNPDYLKKNTVLNLTADQTNQKLVLQQILIQAKERFPFSPAPDQIMGSLLIDLGDCFAGSASIQHAKALYNMAEEYHGADSVIVASRISSMVKLAKKYNKVFPENENKYGFDERVENVNYKNIIRSWKPYLLEWAKINTDVNILLEYANMKAEVTASQKSDTILKGHEFKNRNKTKASPPKKAPFFIFGGVAFIILIAIAARKRNKRAR